MPYGRLERRLAAMLDAAPAARRLVKSGYQRLSYLLSGGRGAEILLLHPEAAIQPIEPESREEQEQHVPRERFFGYFGISPWSRDGSRYLFHRLRARNDSSLEICVRDLRKGLTRVLCTSSAWTYQQGSMTQWLTRDDGTQAIAFNHFVDRQLVCRILSDAFGERQLPWPIQALHPLGTHALSLNYRRLWRVQPEYGYDVAAQNFSADAPVDSDGLWLVDLESGQASLCVSLDELAEHRPRPEMVDAEHQVNHAVFSPRGTRMVFMHRWTGRLGKFSRLYCAKPDGRDLLLLLDHRMVSHYAWRDEDTLLVWGRTSEHGDRYYVIDVATGAREICCAGALDRHGDGHPAYSPDGRWLVTDSYPDRRRMRHLLLCRPATDTVIELGAFLSPWRYDGAERCDLHPRWSPDGRLVSIDSTHEGTRNTYAIDVHRLLT
jgi:hypothetical protein